MGSPFNHCKIITKGFLIPEIGTSGFQDIESWSPDLKFLALVKWDIIIENKPGFKVLILDVEQEKLIHITNRVEGICKSIELSDNFLVYEKINIQEKHKIQYFH